MDRFQKLRAGDGPSGWFSMPRNISLLYRVQALIVHILPQRKRISRFCSPCPWRCRHCNHMTAKWHNPLRISNRRPVAWSRRSVTIVWPLRAVENSKNANLQYLHDYNVKLPETYTFFGGNVVRVLVHFFGSDLYSWRQNTPWFRRKIEKRGACHSLF